MPRFVFSSVLQLSKLFREFYDSEKTGGIILLACTLVSLFIANTSFSNAYSDLWHTKAGPLDVGHWINDGLMTLFFLLIGLELEREIYLGELSDPRNAMLPIAAAIGGILLPAGIYMFFNHGTHTQSGTGIPMATDIAFALGILSLLGKRVPSSLKVFLAALAVADDLAAIIIIAVFYSKTIVIVNLLTALLIFIILLVLNRFKVHSLIPYIVGGVAMWYFMFLSGVHATITGVLLAFAVPFGDGRNNSPSLKLQHRLHKPVAFIILPLFALANTAIIIKGDFLSLMTEPYALGITGGLFIGKPLGIIIASLAASLTKCCYLPSDISFRHILGAGFLAGIGFTMSVFITLLAFEDAEIINNAKLMILLGSLASGITGFLILRSADKKKVNRGIYKS